MFMYIIINTYINNYNKKCYYAMYKQRKNIQHPPTKCCRLLNRFYDLWSCLHRITYLNKCETENSHTVDEKKKKF